MVATNIYNGQRLLEDLALTRADIVRAVLLVFGRRRLNPGERVPDLAALRRYEAELIDRLYVLGMIGGDGQEQTSIARAG